MCSVVFKYEDIFLIQYLFTLSAVKGLITGWNACYLLIYNIALRRYEYYRKFIKFILNYLSAMINWIKNYYVKYLLAILPFCSTFHWLKHILCFMSARSRRIRQITFFLENTLKKTTEYFLKFLFLFESTILPVNNAK